MYNVWHIYNFGIWTSFWAGLIGHWDSFGLVLLCRSGNPGASFYSQHNTLHNQIPKFQKWSIVIRLNDILNFIIFLIWFAWVNQTQTTVVVCRQLPKHHTVCINTFIIIHDAKKRLLSFLPVLESSDNFLNENDLISYGLVPLDFQQHVMMVLPKVEKHFYMNSNPLLRCSIHHQIV